MDEPAPARVQRGQTLIEATKEDLDLFGVKELEERIDILKDEIARVETQLGKKAAGLSAADALFSFKRD